MIFVAEINDSNHFVRSDTACTLERLVRKVESTKELLRIFKRRQYTSVSCFARDIHPDTKDERSAVNDDNLLHKPKRFLASCTPWKLRPVFADALLWKIKVQ
jgi:hypothetical protein